ncbi:MAG TPA: glycoside hydrolase family 5 protein [Pyrinomonadaceae bacterium]|jgi:endoglucanase
MTKAVLLFLVLTLSPLMIAAQETIARARAERLGLGMNLSYLDNWWTGTKAKNYGDFVKAKEVARREKMFADIARAGFKTVRIPVNFGAWANYEKPFRWENDEGLRAADSFVKWASDNNLNAIIDLHHVEFDGSVKEAATTERIVWLWREIAARYKNTNAEKVFFELRNEPHDIAAQDWRQQAEEIIKTVRRVAPNHTLIVGFHDWNSRKALVESAPFDDPNIIYTFHYYDPFIFTHQGATWAGEGLPDLKGVPFPANSNKISVPASAKGKWVETQIGAYREDSVAEKMFADLRAAKEWSEKNKVPIFLGEFGSYSKYADAESRCRHAETVYTILGKLQIPNAWWEWDGSFNMFKKGTTEIFDCMRKAIDSYHAQK